MGDSGTQTCKCDGDVIRCGDGISSETEVVLSGDNEILSVGLRRRVHSGVPSLLEDEGIVCGISSGGVCVHWASSNRGS